MATTKQRPERKYSAPALEKGLDILELLSEQTEGMSQSQVARALDRTPSEIFRMLTCLVERGYVDRGATDDLYRLSAKLFALSHRHPPTKRLLETALPVMRRLAESARQSCHLAIRHESEALIVAQTDSPGFMGFAVRVGARVPLAGSCSGNILLAFQSPNTQAQWLDEVGASHLAVAEREQLAARLGRIRERGLEHRQSPITRGIIDLGCPVLDTDGAAMAALTVPCLEKVRAGVTLDEIEGLLLGAARTISENLGG